MSLAVPVARLAADVAWWPLGSVSAFLQCTTGLARENVGVLNSATKRLATGLDEHLRTRAGGDSLESLHQLRDGIWFRPEPAVRTYRATPCRGVRHRGDITDAVPLHKYLMGLAHDHIELDGSAVRLSSLPGIGEPHSAASWVRPAPDRSLCEEAARWRWLSFALPPDLLIAAKAAQESKEPPADHVSLGTAPLDRFLESEQIAELHLHIGAAVTFQSLWTNLMTRIGNDSEAQQIRQADRTRNADSFPFGSSEAFHGWLATAALARMTLAAFLWRRERGETVCASAKEDLDEERDECRHAYLFSCFITGTSLSPGRAHEHRCALEAFVLGRTPAPEALTRSIYRRYSGVHNGKKGPSSVQALGRADPLSSWLRGTTGASPETRFLTRALTYLDQHEDKAFAQVFWQYVRIRCLTYRHLTQEPGTRGLDWFHRHFERIKPFRAGLDMKALISLALEVEARGGARLGSLEVRTAPTEHWQEIRNMVRIVAQAKSPSAMPGLTQPERGLVLHFTKESHSKKTGRLHADPQSVTHGCRFGAYFYERLRQATAIEGALRRDPKLLLILRGIDVCTIELAVPTWVFLPLIDKVRKASVDAAARLASQGLTVRPMGITLHAGEDYRRLSEGLRRIHEPVEYGLMRDGGRFGHAVALGDDPDHWTQKSPRTMQPNEERLDDLLWEMSRYRRAQLRTDPDRVEYVRAEIERLARYIYEIPSRGHGSLRENVCGMREGGCHGCINSDGQRNFSIDDLIRARDLRHSPHTLQWIRYPFVRRCPMPSGSRSLVCRYLTDVEVFRRGQEPVEVLADDGERRMLREAQRFIRSQFAQLGVTIEANPSSNLLIADLADIEQHPIFRLQPLPGQPEPEGGRVWVALGDDDPVTFATCLPEEFTYLYFALVRRGVPAQDAVKWLDDRRRNGWRARFTLPCTSDDNCRRWVATKAFPRPH